MAAAPPFTWLRSPANLLVLVMSRLQTAAHAMAGPMRIVLPFYQTGQALQAATEMACKGLIPLEGAPLSMQISHATCDGGSQGQPW